MIFHRFGVLTIKYALKRERERTSFDRRKKKKKEKSTFESLVIGRRRDR